VSASTFDAQLKEGGASMSAKEVYAKRNNLSTVVASELWRIRERVAATGPVQNIDPELQALLAPERQRLLDEMAAVMNRMVEQIHGAL
jgi:hypothetical protein